MSSEVEELNIKRLLDPGVRYDIPLYQRNFSWGEKEVSQLFRDILDYVENQSLRYYLGILVVDEKEKESKEIYEVVDGQQRLTVLHLMAVELKDLVYGPQMRWYNEINLTFSHREKSDKTLNKLFTVKDKPEDEEIDESIWGVSNYICQLLENDIPNEISVEEFAEYFFQNVRILRVPLPEETDLNHYFEVMNTRGEQLEKHEVLKARMMDVFNQSEDGDMEKEEREKCKRCFNKIWKACSDMDRYVQLKFNTVQRDEIFGADSWDDFEPSGFEEVCDIIAGSEENQENGDPDSLKEILSNGQYDDPKESSKRESGDFHSVIDFTNFLLQVLRIQLKNDKTETISLDDKQLIEAFSTKISEKDPEFVKDFAFNLLKIKYLFDRFVIKRDERGDKWSLKHLQRYESNSDAKFNFVNTFTGEDVANRKVRMLNSMFHVSTPTLSYKYWLNGVLTILDRSDDLTSEEYIMDLESLAKAFVFDRILAKEPKSYSSIIFGNKGKTQNTLSDLDWSKTIYGNIPHNLLFNYVDYLIWITEKSSDDEVDGYSYKFRSSVEHHFPRKSMEKTDIDGKTVNSFGNLYLIEQSKNSRLSNMSPTQKKSFIDDNYDSLKQYKMLNDYDEWSENTIKAHEEGIKELLKNQISG